MKQPMSFIKDGTSFIFLGGIWLLAQVFFACVTIALIDVLYSEARRLLTWLGLKGWPLVAIPLLCGPIAGWLAWRYLRGGRRTFALFACLVWIGLIALHLLAPGFAYQYGL